MQIPVPIQPGNSGGPLFGNSGELLGVTSSSLNAVRTLVLNGTLPQNVNYAIKSDYIQPLVREFGEYKIQDMSKLDNYQRIEQLQKYVGMVLVY